MNKAIEVYNDKIDPLAIVLQAIKTNRKLQDSTKDQYTRAIENYSKTGRSLTDPHDLQDYMNTVSPSTQSFLSATIGILARDIEIRAKSSATPENVLEVQAMVYKAQALQDSIQVERVKGSKSHVWLSAADLKALIRSCDTRATGKLENPLMAQRDKMVIRLLAGAGLRRTEGSKLEFADMNQEGDRCVLNVLGKGAKLRPVPISSELAGHLKDWLEVVGDGRVLRTLGRGGKISDSMGTGAIYNLVAKRGKQIGKPELQPHDLRRTYAQLGYAAGVDIGQISKSLGHLSIKVTQDYLNLEIDLETAVSDFIPLG